MNKRTSSTKRATLTIKEFKPRDATKDKQARLINEDLTKWSLQLQYYVHLSLLCKRYYFWSNSAVKIFCNYYEGEEKKSMCSQVDSEVSETETKFLSLEICEVIEALVVIEVFSIR